MFGASVCELPEAATLGETVFSFYMDKTGRTPEQTLRDWKIAGVAFLSLLGLCFSCVDGGFGDSY